MEPLDIEHPTMIIGTNGHLGYNYGLIYLIQTLIQTLIYARAVKLIQT